MNKHCPMAVQGTSIERQHFMNTFEFYSVFTELFQAVSTELFSGKIGGF